MRKYRAETASKVACIYIGKRCTNDSPGHPFLWRAGSQGDSSHSEEPKHSAEWRLTETAGLFSRLQLQQFIEPPVNSITRVAIGNMLIAFRRIFVFLVTPQCDFVDVTEFGPSPYQTMQYFSHNPSVMRPFPANQSIKCPL